MIKHSLSNLNNLNMLIILSMIKQSLSNQFEHVNNTFYD